MRERLRDVDGRALLLGIAVGIGVLLAVAVAFTRVRDSVDADERSWLVTLLLAVALLGLGAAGWLAARRCRRAPLAHATTAALGAVVFAELGVIAGRALGDGHVRWEPAAAWLLVAVACGTTGGLVALRSPRRPSRST